MICLQKFGKTYHIPEENMPRLYKAVNQLNKRLQKITEVNSGLLVFVLGETTKKDEDTFTIYKEIEIVGEIPQLEGFYFCGTLDHCSGEDPIVRTIPGKEIPDHFWKAEPICDHCGYIRKRKKTFIICKIEGDEEVFMQVGSSCIKDFFGDVNVLQVANACESLSVFNDEMETLRTAHTEGNKDYCFLIDYLCQVSSCMREHGGYISKKLAHEKQCSCTAQLALSGGYSVTSQDHDLVSQTVNWARSIDRNTCNNEYLHNLSVIAESDGLRLKNSGFAASMIYAYQKSLTRQVSNWVGEIGNSIDLDVNVLSVKQIEGGYGLSWLYKMRDSSGNNLVWFSSKCIGVQEGWTINIKGTVKDHGEYLGNKQTILTRCRVRKLK